MAKNKSLAMQIEEIVASQEKLSDYEKLFDKACQINFGCSTKNLKKFLEKKEESFSNFEAQICTFFGLKTEKDMADFIQIMCAENILNYYKNEISKREE